jgi:Transglutaminase elicitor
MIMHRHVLGAVGFFLVVAGCSAARDSSVTGTEQADRWDPNTEEPSKIIPGATVRLADLANADDVGKEFGVDDDHVPYPDTYWPFTQGGIDAKWNGDNASPLDKAMGVLNPGAVQAAKDWEHQNHGSAVPGVADWWGHCPGWTGAAMFDRLVVRSVTVRNDGNGGVLECAAGDSGCTKFEVGDINALEAEAFVDGDDAFLGARCDTKPADIQRDKYGRIARNGTGCHGLNAGALLVILGNRMKRDHLPMAIDAQSPFNTDQIWNQPAYRYSLNALAPITKDQAIKRVAGSVPVDGQGYVWNADAVGFVEVDITIKWVRELGPNLQPVSGKDSTRTMRMSAVIELDRDPSDEAAKVIGGEYLDDASTFADRLFVPPFVWITHGPGSDDLDTSAGGTHHNPYLKPSFVQNLVLLASAPAP